ncbi:MAG: preprotein translocase subunit SecG [Eubacteriales bacterium]
MTVFNIIAQIALLVMGLFLIVAVLMQQGKAHGLSSTIAGGAETFFGKEQGTKISRLLSRWTTIVGLAFVVLVVLVFVIQPNYSTEYANADLWKNWSAFGSIFAEK